MRKGMVWAALAAAAGPARGQGQASGGGRGGGGSSASAKEPVGPTSGAFNQACVDFLRGRMPQGDQAIKTLRDACANLMSGRADERIQAEQRRQQQQAAQEQLRLQAQGALQPSTTQVQDVLGRVTTAVTSLRSAGSSAPASSAAVHSMCRNG